VKRAAWPQNQNQGRAAICEAKYWSPSKWNTVCPRGNTKLSVVKKGRESSRMRMRSSRDEDEVYSSWVVRASDCQSRSRNCPMFEHSIHRHSGIWGAADEAVLNKVLKKEGKGICSPIGLESGDAKLSVFIEKGRESALKYASWIRNRVSLRRECPRIGLLMLKMKVIEKGREPAL